MDENGNAAEMERYLKNVGHWHAYLTTVAQRAEEKAVLEARAAALKPPQADVTPEPLAYDATPAYVGPKYEPHPPDETDPPKPNRRLGIGGFKRDR